MKLAILSFLVLFMAQQSTELASQNDVSISPRTLSVNVDRVNVLFTVAHKNGRFITNLRADDFTVFEEDERQTITNFSTETDLPLNVALLVDTSGSVRQKLAFEKQAARQFFESSVRRGTDKALIMSFDSEISVLQNFTDDPDRLSEALERIICGGSTALFDAISDAAGARLGREQGRRVIIVLSDGMDNSSHNSVGKTLETAQKNDVVVYVVSTSEPDNITREQKLANENMDRLARETGGNVLFPTRNEDLAQAFKRISEELRSQYSLAYGPTNPSRDGSYRRVRIIPSRRGYHVRAREGYFAPRS
jgi:Ca-activated chloride channel family protein